MRRKPDSGGGWRAIRYALGKARAAGGFLRLYRALRSRNACKTCALGMGGQRGGMVNEAGRFPEVCKKSIQAAAADMGGGIREHFFDDFGFEKLRAFSARELEAAGRLTEPLYAGPLDTNYRSIGWEEALERIAAKIAATDPDESFFYFSGRSSNEAGFLGQLFARLWGTNNINNCSYYCHQASGVGLSSVTGSGTATVVLDDVEHCDLLFIIGANPASNHPRLMRMLVGHRRRGGKVIVINPLREIGLVRFKVPSDVRSLLFGSTIADLYVQPHIGGDIALLAGVAKLLRERGALDEAFIRGATDGSEAFLQKLESLAWERIIDDSGVDRATIERIADLYAASKKAIFCWAMGITHHVHGVENVQMIANLALMRGMVGRPRTGLLPLRGHSNVQGMGSMGVVPNLKPAVRERIERTFDVTLPAGDGLDTLDSLAAAEAGRIRFAWCLGGNLFGSNPDAASATRALANVDKVVYLSTTLNTGHVHGRGKETIILPVLARDEEPEATSQESMFNYVRLSDGGPGRYEGPRSEVELVTEIAGRVLGDTTPLDWSQLRDHRRIREAIGEVIPGYEALGVIDDTRREFQIGGRTFHEPRFATDTGHARFHDVDLPEVRPNPDGRLRLMTVRSEGQFNTVVYEDHDIYRGQERRDVIMLNPADIARLGLEIDQIVTVRSDSGSLDNIRVREIDIRCGNAVMYFPEANAVVPRQADPRSGTPPFKNTTITIEAAPAGAARERSAVAELAGKGPRRNLRAC
jgi:molybdopterin-dependent oxidoreductase alpha subunit